MRITHATLLDKWINNKAAWRCPKCKAVCYNTHVSSNPLTLEQYTKAAMGQQSIAPKMNRLCGECIFREMLMDAAEQTFLEMTDEDAYLAKIRHKAKRKGKKK